MNKATFSYRLSGTLSNHLEQITTLRQEILLTPLPIKTTQRYRWDALIEKIYWSLRLDGESLSKADIIAVLNSPQKKDMSHVEIDIHRYRYAFDYIYREWLGSKKPITTKMVLRLYELIGRGKIKEESSITTVLEYLQTSTEHPVLQAAIMLIEIFQTEPFTKDTDRIARITAYLFLYKYGYDVDGMLVMEEILFNHREKDLEIREKTYKDGNITPWLEHLTQGIAAYLTQVKTKVAQKNPEAHLPAKLFELTERQQAILSYLEKPGSRITNRKCTSLFKVSQITASRELSKMASLGLLFAYGRGRSVYYTKV